MKHHSIFRAFATVFFTFYLASFLQGQATGFTCDRIWINFAPINNYGDISGIYNRLPLPADDPFISAYDPNCNCWSSDKRDFSLTKLKHDGKWYLFSNKGCKSSGTPSPYAISAPATDCDPTKIQGAGGAVVPNAKWSCSLDSLLKVTMTNGDVIYASPMDNNGPQSVQWGSIGTDITALSNFGTGINGDMDFNGEANTTAIVTQLGINNGTPYAAKLCADLVAYGFDDWYLPALGELNEMFKILGPVAKGGSGQITKGAYWSSTEYTAYNAWIRDFITGNHGGYGKDRLIASCRCVRR